MKRIVKSQINTLLRYASQKYDVFVPVMTEQKDVLFTEVPKSTGEMDNILNAVCLDDLPVVIPPKDIYFPQLENMFAFDGDRITYETPSSNTLLFGIRPCDLKGLLFADEFFKRNYEDIYYLSRVENRLIVTIGCLSPPRPDACFCTSAKTGPFADSGFDLQLIDAGDAYYVEVGSQDGQAFVDESAQFFREADGNALSLVEQIKQEARENVKLKVNFEQAIELMKGEYNFEEIFRRISERCLYCGACLYACPTCTCFNVFDEKQGSSGLRRRNWDTCVFAGYTREASGHNPRAEKWIRTARRYEHKLKYDCVVAGESGCVGCGRCLSSCPVNIGMSKFIQEITENVRTM